MKCEMANGGCEQLECVVVVVAGCLEHLHVNEYYYCVDHAYLAQKPHYCLCCLRGDMQLNVCDEHIVKNLGDDRYVFRQGPFDASSVTVFTGAEWNRWVTCTGML
jgi:hypothetical protein